jgi:acetyl-CoA acetyltransferase
MTARGYGGVAAAVPVTIPYEKRSEKGVHWWLGRALGELVARAGIAKSEIDGLIVASYTLRPDTAVSLTEYFGLTVRWLEDLPMGGASGPIALRHAARVVEAGEAEVVACIAGDVLGGAAFGKFMDNYSSFSRAAALPYGAAGPNLPFALVTRHYMERTGATREDMGRICVAQRHNGAAFPHALLNKPLAMAEYLAARPIAEPLHLFDCVMPCSGAEGFLVMSEERAKAAGLAYARILAGMERHNAYPDAPVQVAGGWPLGREALYDAAGLGPGDMRFLQAYDDYPVIVMFQLEGLGFCEAGEAPGFVRTTDLTADGGGLPLNTGGGQLSMGQAGAVGGFVGMTEGLRQVTGQALGIQVKDAEVGLVSGYGSVNYDRGLCASAVILARGGGG